MDNKPVNRTIKPRKKRIQNCTNCEYAKFDDIWGELKCSVFHHRCSKEDLDKGCGEWVEKKTQD